MTINLFNFHKTLFSILKLSKGVLLMGFIENEFLCKRL